MNRSTSWMTGALLLLASIATGSTFGCSGSSSGDSGGSCPAAAPTPGTACSLPDSTNCTYGEATSSCDGPAEFSCREGQWEEAASAAGAGAPAPLACPATKPADGSPCETTCGSYRDCTYGECEGLTCVNGKWFQDESFAACIPDGGVDASTSDASAVDSGAEDDAGDGG